MRKLLALFVLLTAANLHAGRLDIAVVQFPGHLAPGDLAAAFAKEELVEMTNAARVITKQELLKSGTVLFAQSVTASRNTTVIASTRINDDRADTLGRLTGDSISLTVTLEQGVKLGLRAFGVDKKAYNGSGTLPNNTATVLGVRQFRLRGPKVVKDQAQIVTNDLTTVLVAQYVP